MNAVPEIRVRTVADAPIREDGDFILYWMIAYRRTDWNFALQRAVGWARELGRPLVILEALRVGYPWASDRLHRFVLDGMAQHARRLRDARALYYPYVEPRAGAGSGLLAALGRRACVVVTDDYPAFFLPRMVAAAGDRLDVRLEAVDSNGLLPLRAADKAYPSAHTFRRHLQRSLPHHLRAFPLPHPLQGDPLPRLAGLPGEITRRWPAATDDELDGDEAAGLPTLPIDHTVAPVTYRGGPEAAQHQWGRFLGERLGRYSDSRNEPDAQATSGLSSYLHFGHISTHRVFEELAEREGWDLDLLADEVSGRRSGWWGMSEDAEAFLDELVTWRELGFNMCAHRDDYDRYESLPDWARETLEAHLEDEREHRYSLEEFEGAHTHDRLWNAAQNQLRREGRIHNYLRMLWGKKILHWSPTPRDALDVMIELNNKYALDGRDPNSYSGIFWCLGRYDRPWGPERPIFGKVRYMTSKNTARKYRVDGYIERYDG